MPPSPVTVPVVAIGASAGGLEVLRKFLGAMPPDSGVAFVLLLHLDPTHESLMADLLSRQTKMTVSEIEDHSALEPDHVYVIPPGRYVEIQNGKLHLTEPSERRGMRLPIDHFLFSLAESMGDRGIGIILSGTGTDGTLGLKTVRAKGGLTLVQEPTTAPHDGMPRSAIATGMVDYVLPVEEMPDLIGKYARQITGGAMLLSRHQESPPDLVETVLSLLHSHTGQDFHYYKKSTLVRRIERRVGLLHLTGTEDYLRYLRGNPKEIELLFKDLLIGVTSFFRDKEAYEFLEKEVLPVLIPETGNRQPLRIWIPGCSTGEEAYSIAMLVAERVERVGRSAGAQIFATDIDDTALEHARSGLYPESIAADVGIERLSRFFEKQDAHYQIKKEIRESVVFALQNLISDPPFSKMDLISCRNLMIYLEPHIQQRAIAIFHFALKRGGYLFLGTSESTGSRKDLFEPLSKKWHVYRHVGVPTSRESLPAFSAATSTVQRALGSAPVSLEEPRFSPQKRIEEVILRDYGPACAVIDAHLQVIHFTGSINQFLAIPSGKPSADLAKMIPEDARPALRVANGRQEQSGRPTSFRFKIVGPRRRARTVKCTISRLEDDRLNGLRLAVFGFERGTKRKPSPDANVSDQPLIQQLESELEQTKEDLQRTLEQHETSNEELKASNEEVTSMNEELQSTNEELESSKEELQSLNEELTTVNNQLQEKLRELEQTNDDLSNLLKGTEIGTMFLDAECRIKRYTPAVTDLFSLIPTDIDRPIQDVRMKFTDEHLSEDLDYVLNNAVRRSREVQSESGKWYSRTVLPYRVSHGGHQGLVLTFVDITSLKASNEARSYLAEQQRVIAQIGASALEASNIDLLLEQTLEWIADTLGVEFCKFLELDEENSEFRLRAGYGFPQELKGYTIVPASQEYQPGYTLAVGTPTIVQDAENETRFKLTNLFHDSEIRSSIQVPVAGPNRKFGVLGAGSSRQHNFAKDDIEFLTTAANFIVAAIRRVEAEQELQQVNSTLEQRISERAGHIVLLKDLAQMANRTERLEEAFEESLSLIAERMELCYGRSFRRQPETGEYRSSDLWFVRSGREDELLEWRKSLVIAPAESVVGRAAQEGKPQIVASLGSDEEFHEAIASKRCNAGSVIAIPVRDKNRVEGVLEIFLEGPIAIDEHLHSVFDQISTILSQVCERERYLADIQFHSEILNQTRDAVFVIDRNRNVLYLNETARHFYDVQDKEVIGKSLSTILTPKRYEQELPTVDQVIRDDGWTGELIHERPGKPDVDVEVSAKPLYDHYGSLIGVVAVARDISSRRAAERAIRDTERLYRAVGDAIKYGIWATTPDGNCIYVSESFLELTGLTQEECFEFGWLSVLHPDDREATRKAWEKTVESEKDWDMEHRIKGADGAYHYILSRGVPVRDDSGEIVNWVGMNLDISRIKEAEEALRRSNQDLQQFAFAVSHDLKQPLRSIIAFADLIERQHAENLPDQAQKWFRSIKQGAGRMWDLIEGLLSFSASLADAEEAVGEPCKVHTVLEAVNQDLSRLITEGGATIKKDLQCDKILLPEHELRTILQNLLANAIKYRDPERDLIVTVSAESANGGGQCRITVEDNGVGIPEQYQEEVFKLFRRLQATGGSGIGLALCRRMVERRGGRIWAESEEGAGSKFIVEVPNAPAEK